MSSAPGATSASAGSSPRSRPYRTAIRASAQSSTGIRFSSIRTCAGRVDRRAYLEAKFGGLSGRTNLRASARCRRVRRHSVRARAHPAAAHTRDAHRLIAWAQGQGDAGGLVERLFRAYFLDGRYIGDRAVLAEIAGEAGLDTTAAAMFLDSGQLTDRIVAMDARARELGVEGVPFFVFGERVAVSGAHEPTVLRDAIAQAREPAEQT